jgi:hypothetical protein
MDEQTAFEQLVDQQAQFRILLNNLGVMLQSLLRYTVFQHVSASASQLNLLSIQVI